MNPIQKLFSCSGMVKPSSRLGDFPSTKEAYKTLLTMAWPSAIETVLVSLISSVDTIMVGGLGPHAIAAVGITNQPKFIVLCLIFSLNVGVTAVVARRKGQNDSEGANRCLVQSLILCAGMALLLSSLGFLFARPIIQFAGADWDTIDAATDYFRIIMIGNFFSSLGLTITAAQRGSGNTKISMTTNLAANLVNVVFNFLLIEGRFGFPRLEVQGAAVATSIGNFVAFVMACFSVSHRTGFLHISFKTHWGFDKETLTALAKVGGSALVEQLFMRIGFFAYAKIVAGLGTIPLATHQICMNILNISFAFGDGLSIAASALVGQKLGAKRPDLSILYGKVAQRVAFCISSCLMVAFILGRRFFVSLFSSDPTIIEMAVPLMYIMAVTTFFQTAQVVFFASLRGAGDTTYTALISFVSIGILRPTLAWVFCYPVGWGLIGAWASLLVDLSLRLILSFTRFSSGKWTKISL